MGWNRPFCSVIMQQVDFRGSTVDFPQSFLSDSCLQMKKPSVFGWLICYFYPNHKGCFLTAGLQWIFLSSVGATLPRSGKTKRKRSSIRSLQLLKITLEIATRCFAINEKKSSIFWRLKRCPARVMRGLIVFVRFS